MSAGDPTLPPGDSPLERLLTTYEAATILGLSVRTLAGLRWRGGGPAYVAISRNVVRYRHGALMEWADGRTRRSTTEARLG